MKKRLRKRKCREKAPGCHGSYIPRSSLQKTCPNPLCAIRRAKRDREKREAEKKRRQRAIDRAARERLKTIPQLTREAQAAFNRYIRARDKDQPCISCGRPPGGNKYGGVWDAGHYLSTGARPWLRFHEDNCHKQCVQCNRDRSGSAATMRLGMIRRIGEARVIALETAPAPERSWTKDELRAIKREYARRARELKREQ